MSASGTVFGDAPGPRGRRRVLLVSLVATALVVAAVGAGLRQLSANGQLDAERWQPFGEWEVWRFLLVGMRNTLEVAALAMALALAIGTLMALGRLSRRAPLRLAASAYVEFFRGFPLLLLILFSVFGLRSAGIDISTFSALTIALAAYNSSIIAEIVRAGVRSIDRGQTEAGLAVGLSPGQAMRLVVLPQAVRRMIPALVGQIVVLLKDTSLGFFIQYEELLRRGQITGTFDGNLLQAIFVVACMYIAVNTVLSQLARRLEVRQQRRVSAGSIRVGGAEDLAALTATSAASRRP